MGMLKNTFKRKLVLKVLGRKMIDKKHNGSKNKGPEFCGDRGIES